MTATTEAHWQRLRQLYEEALTLEVERRLDFAAEACGEDRVLHGRLVALLTGAGSASSDPHDHSTWLAAASRSPIARELSPGHMIGRYRVLKTLGRGGMGVVYLAERADNEFEQRVAVKVVADRSMSSRITARLRSERQILASLNHPNIARLFDGGATDDGSPFLVMEYVEGERIDAYVKGRELEVQQRLTLFQQVCAAVQYAHTQLVVHRDIKPSNILVTRDGIPKLLDFGIAKLLGARTEIRSTDLTLVHERVMSPEHASPEQVRGEPVTTASDVYALGVLLYILLTDRKPFYFAGASIVQIERAILNETPIKPSVVLETSHTGNARKAASAQALRGDLDTIVMKAMHKDPAQRYETVNALAEDVANYLASRPIKARPDSLWYRARKFWRRNRLAVVTTSIAASLLIGVTVFYTLRLAAERDIAERERLTALRVSQFMTEVFRVANPSETRGDTVPVREVLDAAVKRIREDLSEEPQVRVELMRKMAQAYIGIGLWGSAESLLEDAVKHARSALGEQSIELARTLMTLASIHQRTADYDAARVVLSEALSIHEAFNACRDREGVLALLAWAENQIFRTDFDAARETLDRALELASLLEQKPAIMGELFANYGLLHHLRSEYADAERFFRQALPLLEGRTHQGADRYAEIVMNLGEGLIAQGKGAEAAEFLTAHNEELVGIFGATHRVVGDSWNILGIALCDRGAYETCSEAFKKSAEIERSHSPNGSRRLLVRHLNLGSAYYDDGQYEAAVDVLNEAVGLAREMGNELDPILLAVYYQKAASLRELGQLDAAGQALRDAEPVAANYTHKGDRLHAFLAIEQGRLLSARGQHSEAVAALRQSLGGIAPEERKLQASARLALGSALLSLGRCEESVEMLESAYETRRELMPATNWFIYEAQNALGEALSACGRNAQAEEHLVQSLKKLRRLRRASDNKLLAAERALAAHRARQ